MAISDPTATGFVNDKVRPLADNIARLYYVGKQIIDEYNARGGMTFISHLATEIVEDGADQDSRPVLTGEDVTNLGLVMIDIITLLEAANELKLGHVLTVANSIIMPPRFRTDDV